MSNTEVAVVESTPVQTLQAFSSIQGDDLDARFELAQAVMGATPIKDHIGVPFNLAHIVRQPVQVTNEKTGEVSMTYRTTLVTDEGKALAATSKGMDVAIDNILNTLGSPEAWGGRSFPFIAERRGSGTSEYFTLVPVAAAKGKK